MSNTSCRCLGDLKPPLGKPRTLLSSLAMVVKLGVLCAGLVLLYSLYRGGPGGFSTEGLGAAAIWVLIWLFFVK